MPWIAQQNLQPAPQPGGIAAGPRNWLDNVLADERGCAL